MHTACLVFSQLPDKTINPKFDIKQDVQEKLKPFENVLYDYYHFGFGKVGFLHSKFTSISDTIWSNPRNAFIEPLCEIDYLEQYTKSKEVLDYDVMTNFDFFDRVDFKQSLDKKVNKIFHYITHDGSLHKFPFEYQMNPKLPENIQLFKDFQKGFLDYIQNYQENQNNPRNSLFVTVVNCHH